MKWLTASAIALLMLLLLGAQGPAGAAITSVTVVSSTELGTFGHREYREVQIRMRGTAPGGAYDVPVTLAFPERSKDYSGVAVIDMINTAFVVAPPPPPGIAQAYPLARVRMGDYMFASGHVYLGFEWQKSTVESRGIGTIAAGSDAYAIWRDAAALARNPSLVPSGARPEPATTVIAYGYSQTGNVMRGFYRSHQNTMGGGLAFDGALYGAAAGACREPPAASVACNGAFPDGGKVIAFGTETEAECGGWRERDASSNYRYYEIAGSSHIPAWLVHFDGAPLQNPVNNTAVDRAALRNLIEWIEDGTAPPSSDYVELEPAEVVPAPAGCGFRGFRNAVRDADGNVVGGLRLPYMTATHPSGEVGAPLGTYRGNDLAQPRIFASGGTFVPFDAARLDELYPSHGTYVERVAKAAHRLVQRREILQEDAEAYIREAAHSTIGK
jgi:Alpha/beta hydrolase domain